LEELRRLETAATPGPWEAGTLGGYAADVFTVESDPDLGRDVICEHAGIDAEFIVAARNQLPRILDALDAIVAIAERHGVKPWTEEILRITKALEEDQ
jgi:hypothetical protein